MMQWKNEAKSANTDQMVSETLTSLILTLYIIEVVLDFAVISREEVDDGGQKQSLLPEQWTYKPNPQKLTTPIQSQQTCLLCLKHPNKNTLLLTHLGFLRYEFHMITSISTPDFSLS
jgi:hypothetical protein